MRPGHEASAAVESIAVEADTRLKRRYGALKRAGKHANTKEYCLGEAKSMGVSPEIITTEELACR